MITDEYEDQIAELNGKELVYLEDALYSREALTDPAWRERIEALIRARTGAFILGLLCLGLAQLPVLADGVTLQGGVEKTHDRGQQVVETFYEDDGSPVLKVYKSRRFTLYRREKPHYAPYEQFFRQVPDTCTSPN